MNLYLQDSVQTKVEVIAGHFNDLNKKKELDENPERKVTTDDFVASFINE